MIHTIHIPALGANMEKATIIAWLAREGEEVQEGKAVATIETDKASYDIAASGSGFLRIVQREGSEVPVGGVIALIATTREEHEAPPEATLASRQAQRETAAVPAAPFAEPQMHAAPSSIKISGIARKLAEEHGLDLIRLKGTGPAGRITKEDVEGAIAQPAPPPQPAPAPNSPRIQKVIPLIGKKKAMAQRLSQSLTVMAQMTNWEHVDMSHLVNLKKSGLMDDKEGDSGISFNDVFVKFTGIALREYPLVNASLENDQIVVWDDVNIGVAVAMGEDEHDLVVPVIRNVEKKSIRDIARELSALIRKARENKLSLDDLIGGTITITNIGAFGADPGTPIIQLPHAAVVGFGAIQKKPVVIDDEIVIRPIMLLAVTVDHRFITGALSARFRKRMKALLENPVQLLLDFK